MLSGTKRREGGDGGSGLCCEFWVLLLPLYFFPSIPDPHRRLTLHTLITYARQNRADSSASSPSSTPHTTPAPNRPAWTRLSRQKAQTPIWARKGCTRV